MSEIRFKYLIPACSKNNPNACIDCHSDYEEYHDFCGEYEHNPVRKNKDGYLVIPHGKCIYSYYKRCIKSVTAKRYEIYYDTDSYDNSLHFIILKIGKTKYICEEMFIDGKAITIDDL